MKAKTTASNAKLVPTHPLTLPRRSNMTLSAYPRYSDGALICFFDQKLRGYFTNSGRAPSNLRRRTAAGE